MAYRVLIVRLSALGDTALTLPLLSALRSRLPDAFIGWVVGAGASPLLEGHPELDKLHVLDKRKPVLREFGRLVREIRAQHYDVSLDVQGLTKSAILPFLARIPRRIGFAPGRVEGRELSRVLSTELVRPPEGLTHIVSRQLHMGTALGLDMPAGARARVPISDRALESVRAWWSARGPAGTGGRACPTIVFGIGAGWPTKILPAGRVSDLAAAARELGHGCVLLWGPAERDDLPRWRGLLGPEVLVAPQTTVGEMAALLSLADAFAGPDSAPLHLAALLGKPTFSWFGASDPARCAPRGPQHRFVAKELPCRPCWRRSCRSSACVRELGAEEIVPAFREWLEAAGRREPG